MAEEWDDTLANGDVATLQSLEIVFSNILGVAIRLAGLALFVMLIVGGFGMLTAGGDAEKLKKAQGTMTNAVAGFVLLIASWFILKLLEQFTGVTLTQFEIPGY
jgi:hypothetical protein